MNGQQREQRKERKRRWRRRGGRRVRGMRFLLPLFRRQSLMGHLYTKSMWVSLVTPALDDASLPAQNINRITCRSLSSIMNSFSNQIYSIISHFSGPTPPHLLNTSGHLIYQPYLTLNHRPTVPTNRHQIHLKYIKPLRQASCPLIPIRQQRMSS